MGWRRVVATGLHAAEERFDRFRFGLKRRFGLLDPFEVLPYRGYGTPRELFLKGRVLEEAGITRFGQDDTTLENVRNMARRFASDEVAGARVRASFRGAGSRLWRTRRASSTCASRCRSRSRARRGGTPSSWS